jgi:hypothetical protein
MVKQLKKNNPKLFFKYFNNRNTGKSKLTLPEYFRNLAKDSPAIYISIANFMDTDHPVFELLDTEITPKEIEACIRKLKSNKSPGIDCLINEYFSEFSDLLIPILLPLFDKIFNSGTFPSTWPKAVVIPIYKIDSSNDPENYRGISITSGLGTLFTSTIEKWNGTRIETAYQTHNLNFKLADQQLMQYFALQSLMTQKLNTKQHLYCCFIDYKKAIDTINRDKLWFKLKRMAITGKRLQIIRSLYIYARACVKSVGNTSRDFHVNTGLLQGEVTIFNIVQHVRQ